MNDIKNLSDGKLLMMFEKNVKSDSFSEFSFSEHLKEINRRRLHEEASYILNRK